MGNPYFFMNEKGGHDFFQCMGQIHWRRYFFNVWAGGNYKRLVLRMLGNIGQWEMPNSVTKRTKLSSENQKAKVKKIVHTKRDTILTPTVYPSTTRHERVL